MSNTTLKFEKNEILSANFNGLSSLPPIATKLSLSDITDKFNLDEYDGLFVNYGVEECAYPYVYQDMYDRTLTKQKYDFAILENKYLKATFTPSLGGKLWSLFDKIENKELLFKNEVVRPCNLGVRNAWLSGGIEWNSCFKGHGPFTCSYVNTARTQLDDGTPVLRFYYYERIRSAIVQMDFFLPNNSRFLHARMRITNINKTVIPMYWWSNVGATMKDGDRVIVPADESYTVNPDIDVIKIKIPVYNGIDVTYPTKNVTSSDFFWKVKGNRKYICQLDKNGYGLCQTSTALLKGRKLFVWGNTSGGDKWCNFLTADDLSGKYDEIQCGLACTQYESLPMPPNSTWEWLEVYGAMQADKDKIHGDWKVARTEVEKIFDKEVSLEYLEKTLNDTRKMATSKAQEVIYRMEGWGALENFRREKTGEHLFATHLDFGKTQDLQKDWVNLYENGSIGEHDAEKTPNSYMRQKEWISLLEKSVTAKDKDNWYAYYILGCSAVADENYNKAEKYLLKSIELKICAWGLYALAVCYKKRGDRTKEIDNLIKAYSLRKNDVSLGKELFRSLHENDMPKLLIEYFESACDKIKNNERCLLYYAYALAKTDRIAESEKILLGNGRCLVVPDIRECELTTSELWYLIQEKKGVPKDQMGEPPRDLDFRMFTKREGWFGK